MGALVIKALLIAVAAMVVNVAAAFGWVALHSILIAPGHPEAYYEAYAQRAAPWSSVIAGVPILFAAGWLLARWQPRGGWRTGVAAGIAYVAIDAAILIAIGMITAIGGIVAISFITKLLASAAGGQAARRRA